MNPRLLSLLQYIGKDLHLIHCRFCIGHQHHRSKAAPGSAAGSRADILLVGKTGIAEMDVNINQAGNHKLTI